MVTNYCMDKTGKINFVLAKSNKIQTAPAV